MRTATILLAMERLKEISEANPWTMEPQEFGLIRARAFNAYIDLRSELISDHPIIEAAELEEAI